MRDAIRCSTWMVIDVSRYLCISFWKPSGSFEWKLSFSEMDEQTWSGSSSSSIKTLVFPVLIDQRPCHLYQSTWIARQWIDGLTASAMHGRKTKVGFLAVVAAVEGPLSTQGEPPLKHGPVESSRERQSSAGWIGILSRLAQDISQKRST